MIKQFVAQFWMQTAAAVVKIWLDASWTSQYTPLAVLGLGWISVFAADEVADWTGNYGWTRQQWHRRPEWFIRGAGLLALIVVTTRVWWY